MSKVKFNCYYCDKPCERAVWEYKKTVNHFCSQGCAKSYQNKINAKYPIPVTGEKKYNLTFMSHFSNGKKQTYFTCLCDCGEITVIQRNKFGVTKTCNNRTNHKGEECSIYKGYEQISGTYWNSLQHGAKIRNLDFNITIEYCWNLFLIQDKKCVLSGLPINLSINKGKEKTASLDRIDSEKGYVEGNVQWVHKDINVLKMDLAESHFVELCSRVANNLGLVTKLDFDDVLIKPCKSNLRSRNEVNLFANKIENYFGRVVPLIAANLDTVGTFSMAKALFDFNCMTCLHKHYETSQYINFFNSITPDQKKLIFYSVGANSKDLGKLKSVVNEVEINNICLDVANAYSPIILETVEKIKKIVGKNIILMVGNIATPEIIEDFNKMNVHFIKCGIGSGAVCTTRKVAGIGVPQFSCILDCVKEATKYGIHICSDGGCRYPSDVVKAIAGGSSMVMLGSVLSGHEECEGEWEEEGEVIWEKGKPPLATGKFIKKNMIFYGMSSKEAMNKYHDGVADYRASEGKCVKVPYKGNVQHTIKEILGGIRSACAYVGAKNLVDLEKCSSFIRVNRTHNVFYDN